MSQAAFQSLSLFLNLMLDPFVSGRFGAGIWATGPALAFEPGRPQPPPRAEPSIASLIEAGPPIADTFDRRWKVWGSGYGGYNKTGGDSAIGSHDLTARAYGFAAGLDYRLWPNTLVGFAFGGAGTNWGLADALGSGRSDVFQSGVYASTRYGPAYLSAALAYEWHQASTERTVTIVGVDRLAADFHANSFGARVESGYRFGAPAFGLTPYAALQTLSVHAPSYVERATTGSAVFALGYNGQTTSATRSELGAWVDHTFALDYRSLMVLRARAAWAHDFQSDRQIVSIFQALPGASFTVRGASRPRDAALVSAGAEVRLINGFALAAKFDGEFAKGSYTYAGTGSVRYAW
jgi:outer membrane autotransporter protein